MTTSQTFDKRDGGLVIAHIVFAFIALFLGGVAGLLQGLVRGGLITLPGEIGYYQLLTVHGILMAIIFTTYFIIGFMYSGLSKTLGDGKLLPITRQLGWIGYILMTVGTLIAAVLILANKATVLYTFYAPMMASPWFYVALVLVVVGSWMGCFGAFLQLRHWKKLNPGKPSPLFAFLTVTTLLMWFVATIGVAIEVLFMLIPLSFGWVDTINVVLSRTLFWYFGHPLVYFWLMPAYMIWYMVVPKVIGGKMFSDALARLSFIMFLLFSIPVGFHHQLTEPGISNVWKYVQVVLTFIVVVPSFMTAFSMFATFEMHGRRMGATGLFGWFKKLPWGDVRFFAPFMGMLIFIPAGAGGLVNASHQMNMVVHNTLWVTGHFHLTVATAVALTFFGATYWLIPAVTGRVLTPQLNKLGVIQTWIWVIGMFFMSASMHIVGLLGSPRRTAFTTYNDSPEGLSWMPYHIVMAIGGTILFIGVILMVVNVVLLLKAPKGYTEYPLAEPSDLAEKPPAVFERWGLWIAIVVILVLVAYTIPVQEMLSGAQNGAKGVVTW